ncbi:hypothetical protein CMV_019066 [Castanea mollissima]|uniref:Uncharacterized protein n=1 Tax=Castanea mollissima TaxID=60419 RepID=A0A8J4R3N4_9ROSI|nr:hypothetical protein CMV_019066 [Castanea mollissima]
MELTVVMDLRRDCSKIKKMAICFLCVSGKDTKDSQHKLKIFVEFQLCRDAVTIQWSNSVCIYSCDDLLLLCKIKMGVACGANGVYLSKCKISG